MKEKIFLILLLGFFYKGYSQTPDEVQKIIQNYDLEYLQQLSQEALNNQTQRKQNALQLATINNWPITIEESDGTYSELMDVIDNQPIYYTTTNVDAAISTRTNYLNTGGDLNLGLDGTNMLVGVWDGGGVLTSHQEFGSRASWGDTPSTSNFNGNNHATHVTGTIIASGVDALAKGMAPKAIAKTYYWQTNTSEVLDAASDGMLISNHSYGNNSVSFPDWCFGAYIYDTHLWDLFMYYAPYHLTVFAAGNNGTYNYNSLPMTTGYDKLTTWGSCKNNLVVANAQDAIIDSEGKLVSVNISNSSSQGPTDDLRIKPDITGNGYQVYSCSYSGPTNYHYSSGTSMAAPNVTGSLILLQEYYNRLNTSYMRACTLKGLALHTADDILAEGPDAISGWGLLNAKKAAETIKNNRSFSIIMERYRNYGETLPYSTYVYSDGINPLQISLSWSDPAGVVQNESEVNSTTPRLSNDLDLRIYKNGVTYYPYTLTSATTNTQSDNYRDPYERIDIPLAEGYYNIQVTHKGSLSNTPQYYSLIATGIVVCTQTTDMIITEPVNPGQPDLENTQQTITASNFIYSQAEASYRSGEYVLLTDGFYSENGSNFVAEIGLCGSSPMLPTSGRPANNSTTENQEALPNKLNKKLNIYPNPATDIVNIEVTQDIISLSLYTLDGKEIMNKEINSKSYQFDVSKLNSGVYILTAKSDSGELYSEKIIIK